MAQFKDNAGKEYTVAIDGYVLHRARTHGKLSLTSLFDEAQRKEGGKVMIDPALLLELCFYGCEHNAKIASGKVTKEDFLRALTGKALLGAMQATAEALSVCLAAPGQGAGSDAAGGEEPGPFVLREPEAVASRT